MNGFTRLLDKLTHMGHQLLEAENTEEKHENTAERKENGVPLKQWAEQVLVVLQCLGLLIRNPPRKSIVEITPYGIAIVPV